MSDTQTHCVATSLEGDGQWCGWLHVCRYEIEVRLFHTSKMGKAVVARSMRILTGRRWSMASMASSWETKNAHQTLHQQVILEALHTV